MVVLGTTIHEFVVQGRAGVGKLVGPRAKAVGEGRRNWLRVNREGLSRQPRPDRRVVGGAVELARLLVDADGFEQVGGLRREHQMVDAQSFAALPADILIVPEGVVAAA